MEYNFNELLLPDDIFEIVQEEGFWETDEYAPFFIEINFVEGDTEEGDFLFSVQFDPGSSEFEQSNIFISSRGYEQNGYGWAEFLATELQRCSPQTFESLEFDPEAETCSIATVSKDAFHIMLECLQNIFRNIRISQN
ncbi:Imm51 family immunity protein [Chryseobacterium kwangjuense]|uniref:Imm51 family immunity protein n=1 Tax=Chryseobacterium kwangjuense TaxID=267125 RepID=A0ABW9K660_9FLAO